MGQANHPRKVRKRLIALLWEIYAFVMGGGHHYVSTACRHRLHGQCRQTCKFCFAACACVCHQKA